MDEAVLGALAEARALGFLGPGPLEAHVASARAFTQAMGAMEGPGLDLGSGGGVPGLLLAAWYPETHWTLLDRHRRRTSFLARSVAALGWVGRVDVVRAPAEEAAHDPALRGRFAVVTARSFGAPSLTAEIGAGLLAPAGRLLVAEPPEPDPQRWPPAGLEALGLRRVASASTAIAVLARVADVPATVPRPWRQLERRPGW